MKKILIALPLALIMLLSMVPVMAAEDLDVGVHYKENPVTGSFKKLGSFVMNDVADEVLGDEAALKAAVLKAGIAKYKDKYPTETHVYEAVVTAKAEAVDAVTEDKALTVKEHLAAMGNSAPTIKAYKADEKGGYMYPEGTDENSFVTEDLATWFEKNAPATEPDDQADPPVVGEDAKQIPATTDEAQAFKSEVIKDDAVEAQDAEADLYITYRCEEDEEEEETVCIEPCEFITISLRDVHSGVNLGGYSKKFKVNSDVAPEYEKMLDLYLDQYFPWRDWQPLKNYLNVYSIITPTGLEDCEIIIDVIPRFEYIMVVHELWDCCITPDGKVKEELARSFVEDSQKYETWDPAYFNGFGETVMGTPDGVLPIDFLDFHTDLMVNQEKAAEYAANRLEKMNAKDFVFQHATFYPNIRLSAYFTGEVYDMSGKVLQTTWTDGIPTIVIKYLRAECIQTDEKVDDAKVVAGQATSTPVQQLPATGAKDVTAFFMSAVALLGLGIFFAKKR